MPIKETKPREANPSEPLDEQSTLTHADVIQQIRANSVLNRKSVGVLLTSPWMSMLRFLILCGLGIWFVLELKMASSLIVKSLDTLKPNAEQSVSLKNFPTTLNVDNMPTFDLTSLNEQIATLNDNLNSIRRVGADGSQMIAIEVNQRVPKQLPQGNEAEGINGPEKKVVNPAPSGAAAIGRERQEANATITPPKTEHPTAKENTNQQETEPRGDGANPRKVNQQLPSLNIFLQEADKVLHHENRRRNLLSWLEGITEQECPKETYARFVSFHDPRNDWSKSFEGQVMAINALDRHLEAVAAVSTDIQTFLGSCEDKLSELNTAISRRLSADDPNRKTERIAFIIDDAPDLRSTVFQEPILTFCKDNGTGIVHDDRNFSIWLSNSGNLKHDQLLNFVGKVGAIPETTKPEAALAAKFGPDDLFKNELKSRDPNVKLRVIFVVGRDCPVPPANNWKLDTSKPKLQIDAILAESFHTDTSEPRCDMNRLKEWETFCRVHGGGVKYFPVQMAPPTAEGAQPLSKLDKLALQSHLLQLLKIPGKDTP